MSGALRTRLQTVAIGAAACCALAGVAAAQPASAAPPAAAAPQPRYFIEAFDVIGNTLLDRLTVDKAVYRFLGPDRTIDEVEQARRALEQEYQRRGYQAVSVQTLGVAPDNEAVVQFQVTENTIGQLKVTGAKYFSGRQILAQVPALRQGQSPNLMEAQAQLARLDRNGDRRITPKVTVGQQPGTVDIELQVEDKLPYHASITASNDYAPNTSELRVLTQLRATNLWQRGHQFSFSYLVAPYRRDDAEVFAGSYLIPIYNSRWSLLIYGYRSNSNVALLGGANVLGNGFAVGARGVLALPTAGRWSQSLNFGADYKDFTQDVRVPGADPIPSPIRYIPLVASYSAQRIGDRSTLGATLSVTAGARAFDDTLRVTQRNGAVFTEDAFQTSRVGARENFVHANLEVDWQRTLADDTRIAIRTAGQLSDSPLVSNEQFSAGGLTSVRGYLLSESVGDDGASGQFELISPSFAKSLGKSVQDLRIYVFTDAGFVRNRRQQIGVNNNFTLWSLGGGLRARVFRFLTGDVLVAVPLLEGVYSRAQVPTIRFNVKGDF